MTENEIKHWDRYRRNRNDSDALEKLVLCYVNWVKSLASKISRWARWTTQDDLTQEGLIGLVKAIKEFDEKFFDKKFDQNSDIEFKYYASRTVRKAMYRSNEFTRNLARRQADMLRRMRKTGEKLSKKLNRYPTQEEMAKSMAEDEFKKFERSPSDEELSERIKDIIAEIDDAIDSEDFASAKDISEFGDDSLTNKRAVEEEDIKTDLNVAISRLSERERLIVYYYYYQDKTDRQVAEILGMKEDTVRRTRHTALTKLRKLYD
jgi:RNA polymerase sigma factor (sigma-70 family)